MAIRPRCGRIGAWLRENSTPHGRELMKIMGGFYREYFSGLLAQSGCDKEVYFRADSAQRTLETARALAEGVVPGCKVEIHANPQGESDGLFDGTGPGAVKVDSKLALAAVAGRLGPEPQAIVDAHRTAFDTLNRLLNGTGKAAHSIFDEPFRADGEQGHGGDERAAESGVDSERGFVSRICRWHERRANSGGAA